MAINNIATSVRNAMCDAFVDQIDVGSGTAVLRIYNAGFSTLLAELSFSSTAFGSASNGTATANSISDDTSANATGTASVFRVLNKDGTTVFEGTVGVSGADINFNSVSITSGDRISISSMTVTMPAS